MKFLNGARLRALATAAMLAVSGPALAYPIVGSSYSVALTGYYQGGSQTLFNLSTTFGGSQTFTGGGYEGQDITVSSSMAEEGGNTRLTFTVSTPDDFMLTPSAGLPAGVVGYTLSLGGADPIDLNAVSAFLGGSGNWGGAAGGAGFGISGAGLAMSLTYTTNSYSVPASQHDIRSATFSVLLQGPPPASETPSEVPEPAMLGLFGLGAIGLGLVRRRKA